MNWIALALRFVALALEFIGLRRKQDKDQQAKEIANAQPIDAQDEADYWNSRK